MGFIRILRNGSTAYTTRRVFAKVIFIFRHMHEDYKGEVMDKKQLKAQRRQARTDKQREIDRMKYTHDWVSDKQYGVGGTRMQHVNVRCKTCGMPWWNFKMKPLTCNEFAVHEIIAFGAAPVKPAPVISSQKITGTLGRGLEGKK